jgi:hypothetical protein
MSNELITYTINTRFCNLQRFTIKVFRLVTSFISYKMQHY